PECDGTAGEKKKRSAVSGGGTIRLSGTFGDMGGEGNDRRFGMDRTGRKRHRRCLRRHRDPAQRMTVAAVRMQLRQLASMARIFVGILMLMHVMAEMLHRRTLLMLAIDGRRTPGELERYDHEQQDGEQFFHGMDHSIGMVASGRAYQTRTGSIGRNNRSPLKTTIRLAPMSANTAIHSVASPASANARNTSLMPSAMTMFCTRIACARRLRRMKAGSLPSSSSINATSAVSSAVSVPAAPIAKPMPAFASAGASLMPSPTMPT